MENYILRNTKEAQEKAFRLGYSFNGEMFTHLPKSPLVFLALRKDGHMYQTDYCSVLSLEQDHEEITQKDFLALPEPIVVGDWVKGSEEDVSLIFKVHKVKGNRILVNNEMFFNARFCTKLTPEQIKVLVL